MNMLSTRLNTFFLFIFTILMISPALAQDVVRRNDTIPVYESGKLLKLAWTGGLNCAHISEIDLDFDGMMDLFIMEANNLYDPLTGDKIVPLLKRPDSTGGFKYVYAPEYVSKFPKLNNFAVLRDFNQDGKMDIFCRNDYDRIAVYRNDGDATNGLKFTLFIEKLEGSANGLPPAFPFYKDIFQDFVNMTDFNDIDGDGDIDLLVLSRSETFIEYYKNISPTNDTIILEMKSTCWGNAVVNKDTIMLNTCNPAGNVGSPENTRIPPHLYNRYDFSGNGGKGSKDAGVSLMSIDLNGDGVKDLITGTPNKLRMAMNGGTPTASNFTSVAMAYPVAKPAKDFALFATPFYADVDMDNVKDLIVSVIWSIYKNDHSIHFYKNTGTNNNPVFVYQTDELFQRDMIDVGRGSFPTFFDYDGDSLLDIVIGNEGYFLSFSYPQNYKYESKLALYRNIGSKYKPAYELVTKDWSGLSGINLDSQTNQPATGLHPTFGDLDNDGDPDMIVGDRKGKLHYFENNAGAGNPVTFAAPVIDYMGIDVGSYAAPQLIDLNRDDLLDLVVGKESGRLNYYQNTGTASVPQFNTVVDTNLGNVNVTEWWNFWGNSRPFIYEDDSTHEYYLVCGSRSGEIYFYDSLEFNGVISDTFRLLDTSFQNIRHGAYSSIHGADMNADSSMDFIVGNESGGVVLYTGDPNFIYIPGITEGSGSIEVKLFPNPAKDYLQVNIDANGINRKYEAVVHDIAGRRLRTSTIVSGDRIELGGLSPGVYFLQIRDRKYGINSSHKFIIQ